MAQGLNDRIIRVLCKEWEKAEPGTLSSEAIYDQLVAEGEDVPDGAMEGLLERLHESGLINASGMHDRDAIRKHGNRVITSVNTDLLCT